MGKDEEQYFLENEYIQDHQFCHSFNSLYSTIVLSVTAAFGLLPTIYIYIMCMAFSGSFLVRAGSCYSNGGYGLQVGYILKRGSVVYVVFLADYCNFGYLLIIYWPYFSTSMNTNLQ
ncbi:hypothetical protein AN396_10415 [Candidatus Epulonipiscium fishelsonii]|uniref:Uncharacterized protein n=1 Tax=Candidatus Epulonipiscium fishelsonii TaxID=77094 RepID=A0ACC8X959_9FIRM|nr:hypothetical protein AN396_10415 [Epulopiscium sp. SCG-B11WGA-EpuloA1]